MCVKSEQLYEKLKINMLERGDRVVQRLKTTVTKMLNHCQ